MLLLYEILQHYETIHTGRLYNTIIIKRNRKEKHRKAIHGTSPVVVVGVFFWGGGQLKLGVILGGRREQKREDIDMQKTCLPKEFSESL